MRFLELLEDIFGNLGKGLLPDSEDSIVFFGTTF
jgi:hypothetical protein